MIKLAVFDWNGTLLADFAAVHEGCNKMLEIFGNQPISEQDYREVYTIPMQHTFQKLGVKDEVVNQKGPEAVKAFHQCYEPRAAKARTRPGTQALLRELKKQGITCVILSNHTVESIYLHLDRLHLTEYFDTVLANEDVSGAMHSGKQHRIEAYLKDSHIKAGQAVIIGDTTEEIHIGKATGMKTVAITGGYHAAKKLRAEEPDLIINSLNGIIDKMEDL